MEFKTALLKEDTSAAGEFVGYASTWTRTPDSYGDVVAKGAFADTLKAWEAKGQPIPALWGHRMDDPEYFLGAVKEAEEDDHGLRVRVALDLGNPKAAHVHRLLKSGAVAQMSFAFDILEDATVQVEDGVKARELRKVHLYEVSVVPIGANQDTSIETVKAASPEPVLTAAQWQRLAGKAAVSEALSDEEIAALKAIAGEWIASQTDDPQEGEGDSNTEQAEAGQEASKAARAEAVARLNQQIDALTGGQKGAGAE